jgi:hypothetical protein
LHEPAKCLRYFNVEQMRSMKTLFGCKRPYCHTLCQIGA